MADRPSTEPGRGAAVLGRIQARLAELYDLEVEVDVEDFVVGEDVARRLAGDDAADRREALLVVEDDDDTWVALFVDPDAVREADDAGWLDGRFEACCLTVEGVSHFVYLAHHGERGVSELELELQAEIDKYALGLLAGHGVGLIRERSRALRERLYQGVRYVDAEGTERGDRYRKATRLAARYAAELEERFVVRGDLRALARELRRFYRLGRHEKVKRLDGA